MSAAAWIALRNFAYLVYVMGANVALLVFVWRSQILGSPHIRITSWGDFAEDVGGYWFDMMLHMLAWPWFAWKAAR